MVEVPPSAPYPPPPSAPHAPSPRHRPGLGPFFLALPAPAAAPLRRPPRAQVCLHEKRERERICGVCMAEPKSTVFGCGHRTCEACARKLSLCPVCRGGITLRVRMYD